METKQMLDWHELRLRIIDSIDAPDLVDMLGLTTDEIVDLLKSRILAYREEIMEFLDR